MATKEELFKNNPPKGSKAWSEKEDKSEENGIEVSKIKKTNNVAEPVFYDVIKSKKQQNSPRYYQQVKDDFIVDYPLPPLPTKKEEKKEEEKRRRMNLTV